MPERPPHSLIHMDPRRPKRALLAVWCWCGRFYTTTREEAAQRLTDGRQLCPSPDCGKGAE